MYMLLHIPISSNLGHELTTPNLVNLSNISEYLRLRDVCELLNTSLRSVLYISEY